MNRNLEILRSLVNLPRIERNNDPLDESASDTFYGNGRLWQDVKPSEEIPTEKNSNGLTPDGYPVSP